MSRTAIRDQYDDDPLWLATPREIVAGFEPEDPDDPADQYDDDGDPAGASRADKIASGLQEANELDAAALAERDRGQRVLGEANARMARRRAADLQRRSCEARRRTTATIVPRPRARGQRTRRRAAARHAASGSRGDPDLDEPEPAQPRRAVS